MPDSPHPHLSRVLVLLMSLACGIAVGCDYINQPLLHSIARQFNLSSTHAGIIVTTAQITYGAGLLLLVPLGDRWERRRLIVVMTLVASIGLFISASAVSLGWLLLGTALTGLFSVVAQILVPLSATLAPPDERGRVVGTVMSGLLLGILLARTVAGAMSAWFGWRSVYWLAGVLMIAVAASLAKALPFSRHGAGMSYPRLLASVFQLFRDEPVHRQRTLLGALIFAVFAIFWTPLAFLLSTEPYHLSDGVIGLFGLAGAAGALAAGVAGRMADRGQGALATSLALGILVLSWAALALAKVSLLPLALGVVLLDLGVQFAHVSNQNAIYRLQPEARSRLNAGYMGGYFLGGAGGSFCSASLYQHFGWTGVCLAGFAISLLALSIWLLATRPLETRSAARQKNPADR